MGLITKGSNGKGLATTGIVRDSRQAGSSILELQSTKNFVDNNELFHFAQWTTDTVNKPVPGTLIEGTAKLVGNGQVSIERIDPGFTDIGSSIGDIFMIKPTTGWVNDLYDALTKTLNQDGTIRDDVLEGITAGKQDTLVSGTNIRTVNNQSLVGSGNINTPNTTYGEITEAEIEGGNGTTLRTITARRAKKIIDVAKEGKQDALVSGTNIRYINGYDLTGAGNVEITGEDIYVSTSDESSVASAIELISTIVISLINSKQDTLVSGTNIKTINGNSLLGSGNIVISGGGGGGSVDSVNGKTGDVTVLEVPEGGVLGQVVKKQAEGYGWEDESGGSSEAIIVQNTEPDPDPSVIWVNPDEPTEGSEVVSVNDKTGVVVLTKSDIGLGNVDNTADLSKPVSTATQTALDGKQATLVSGTNIKTINGSTLLGSGDLTISGGGGSSLNLYPKVPSGRWLHGMSSGFVTNQAPNGGYVPIRVARDMTIDAGGTNINTLSAGSTVKMALYSDDGTGYPGAKVVDFGTIDSSTTGQKVQTLGTNVNLTAGLHWILTIPSDSVMRLPVTSHTSWGEPQSLWHGGVIGSSITVYPGGYITTDTEPPATAPSGMSLNRYIAISSIRAS